MLELLTPTKSKLLDCKTLSRKNRPADEKPGVKLLVEMVMPNTFLDNFDPALKPMLYEKAKGAKSAQQSLDGVVEATDAPNLTNPGLKLGSINWHHDMTGYALVIARGAGFSKAGTVKLADAILCNWRLTLKEGGTVIARFHIEAGNVPGDAWEIFAELKSREFEMTAKAPEETQRDLVADGEARALEAGIKKSIAGSRKPGASERAAVAKGGGKVVAIDGKKPRPKPHVGTEGTTPTAPKTSTTRSPAGSRTARGRDATKAFLAKQKERNGGGDAA